MARADELRGGRTGGPVQAPWWCLAGAALAHLALLASGAQALNDWKRELLLSRSTGVPTALKVRVVAEPAALPTAPAEEKPLPAAATSGPLPSPPELAAGPGPTPQAAPPIVEPPVYVPRALLSVGPVARTPVLLQWPSNWPMRRSYTAVLRLYLDEQGRVERVEPDGDAALPEPLFEAAQQAFMAADFSPGLLNGQAVKSWVRIEVNFESNKVAAPP
jgi:hypothetical protein